MTKPDKGDVLAFIGLLVGGVGTLIGVIATRMTQQRDIENAVHDYLETSDDETDE